MGTYMTYEQMSAEEAIKRVTETMQQIEAALVSIKSINTTNLMRQTVIKLDVQYAFSAFILELLKEFGKVSHVHIPVNAAGYESYDSETGFGSYFWVDGITVRTGSIVTTYQRQWSSDADDIASYLGILYERDTELWNSITGSEMFNIAAFIENYDMQWV